MRTGGALTYAEWSAATGLLAYQPDEHRAPLVPLAEYTVLSSDGVTVYHVCRFANGRWSCECLGYRYRADCRHIVKVRLELNHG